MNEVIIQNICSDLFSSTSRYLFSSTPTIFLVGPSLSDKSSKLRKQIKYTLEKKHPYQKAFDVYYPEDLFDELMRGNKNFNLLDLENMLANSVHSIVIIPASSGSIAELGCFANSSNLSDKLIVILEKKYKNKSSFIMLGPIKHLKDKNKERIIYYDPEKLDFNNLIGRIRREVMKKYKMYYKVDETLNNPIALQLFILCIIYVFQKISKTQLRHALETINRLNRLKNPPLHEDKLIGTIIKLLIRNNSIQLLGDKYIISERGEIILKRTIDRSINNYEIKNTLDKCRIRILNLERKGIQLA